MQYTWALMAGRFPDEQYVVYIISDSVFDQFYKKKYGEWKSLHYISPIARANAAKVSRSDVKWFLEQFDIVSKLMDNI